MRFDANTSDKLNWAFHPLQAPVTVKFGEQSMAYYEAVNRSEETLTGTAVFNVTPPQAGAYFNKIQCFCFTEQTLAPGQEVTMPVLYYVDPAILQDKDASAVKQITLSYTFHVSAKGQFAQLIPSRPWCRKPIRQFNFLIP